MSEIFHEPEKSAFANPEMSLGAGLLDVFHRVKNSYGGRDEAVALFVNNMVISRQPDSMDDFDHYAHVTPA